MKKLNILLPIATACAAITPAAVMTSCNKTDAKLLTTGDSYLLVTYKVAGSKPGDTINVAITNKSDVNLSTFDKNLWDKSEFTVAEDGTITFYIGFNDYAPSVSTLSIFDLTFNNATTNTEETITDLKFNYIVDYGAELKDGYAAQNAADASHWTKSGFAQYTTDILKDNNIFQNDARYTTAKRIKNSEHFTELESFKAYFNDIILESNGLHLHMNYQVKGTKNNSKFTFYQKGNQTTYEFTNFDFSFSFETFGGYTLQTTAPSNADKTFYIVDNNDTYALDGKFKGKFTYTATPDSGTKVGPKTIEYDGTIDNYNFPHEDEKYEIASMLAFGIIHETYDFEWGETKTVLSMLSPYAANCNE